MITIFTPTFNRAYKLPQVYSSLLSQTNKNFEWIIVDDGSTDNTKKIVNKWIKEGKIKIKYFKQENQGKHIAHNKGVAKANGELFICVDSDDFLSNDAVDIIDTYWKSVKNNKNCIGLLGTKTINNLKPHLIKLKKHNELLSLEDMRIRYKYKGDTALIFKTDIIKKYSFPKIDGEKFIPEGYLYYQISQEGKYSFINKPIYYCEYLDDGYTANSALLIKKNPKGYILASEMAQKYSKSLFMKLRASAKIILGNWLANQHNYFKNNSYKLLMIIALPFSAFVYLKKYKKL